MSRLAPAPLPPLAVTKTWIQTTLKHKRQLYCCRFSADGQFVYAGAQDGTIIRWSLADAEAITVTVGGTGKGLNVCLLYTSPSPRD